MNDNEPAFPTDNLSRFNGLTKREYIAIQAMQGILSNQKHLPLVGKLFKYALEDSSMKESKEIAEYLSKVSFITADAMIEEGKST